MKGLRYCDRGKESMIRRYILFPETGHIMSNKRLKKEVALIKSKRVHQTDVRCVEQNQIYMYHRLLEKQVNGSVQCVNIVGQNDTGRLS